MIDAKIDKNSKEQTFLIAELGDKNSRSGHQNVVGVVEENKDSNGNSCYNFELSQCHETLNFVFVKPGMGYTIDV